MVRQAILRRPIDPPLLRVAVDESVLRRPVGGTEIMAEQLDRLEEVSEVGHAVTTIAVRHTKDPSSAVLAVPLEAWQRFTSSLK